MGRYCFISKKLECILLLRLDLIVLLEQAELNVKWYSSVQWRRDSEERERTFAIRRYGETTPQHTASARWFQAIGIGSFDISMVYSQDGPALSCYLSLVEQTEAHVLIRCLLLFLLLLLLCRGSGRTTSVCRSTSSRSG